MHVIKVHRSANLKRCVFRSVLYCGCVIAVLTVSGSPFHRAKQVVSIAAKTQTSVNDLVDVVSVVP